jgi:hypothetical protein
VDVRAALLRNLVLAGGAFASWSLAGPDPAVREPLAPEVVPVLLMLGAVAAAALTAWRATAWLGRGRA